MNLRLLLLSGLMLLPLCPATAQAPDSAARVAAASPRRLLLKLSTGYTRPLRDGRETLVPLVVGAEYQVAPDWSVYANGLGGFFFSVGNPNLVSLDAVGGDIGVRRYYNQERRRQKGRRVGPGIGNYVALQSASVWRPNYRPPYSRYDYTAWTALWGMQRRLGGHGLLDGYAGLGFHNPKRLRGPYDQLGSRQTEFLLEIGVKLGLVW